MKKSLFTFFLIAAMVLSIGGAAYAKSAKYRYSNGYVMEYKLYSISVAGESGVAAITSTDDSAVAFVSAFSYKNGTVKNSESKQQPGYAYIGLSGEGGNSFRSGHALKDYDYVPYGQVLYLEQ
ncbi:MAG: hypothetical protein K2G45_09165 [Lachnospiraceae bacterium]|nr:hypothetical protein [Lachnospiraceae bacterium]